MFLAEVSFTEISMVLFNAGLFIVALIALLKKPEVKVAPQPFTVQMAAEFVHKSEFAALVLQNQREHENMFSRMGGMERGAVSRMDDKIGELRKDTHQEVKDIHDRINEILSALSNLEGKFDQLK